MNILFVCKYNRFRSKVAEGFFNNYNKNKNNVAKSAGVIRGLPINPIVFEVAKQKGISIVGNPQGFYEELFSWADIIVVTADNVPPEIFKSRAKKLIVWKIKDAKVLDIKEISDITDKISEKVKKFVEEIK